MCRASAGERYRRAETTRPTAVIWSMRQGDAVRLGNRDGRSPLPAKAGQPAESTAGALSVRRIWCDGGLVGVEGFIDLSIGHLRDAHVIEDPP